MISPPARPDSRAQADGEPDLIENGPRGRPRLLALFQEAWRRQRRRRLACAGAVLVAAGAAAAAGIGWPGAAVSHRAPAGVTAAGSPLAFAGHDAGPLVAWVDGNGGLHVASLVTGRQRVIAHTAADPSVPLVAAGGRLYWIDTSGFYSRYYGTWTDGARSLDLATGKVSGVAPGQAVIASADRRQVFVAWTGMDLVEVRADGSGTARQLALPAGWFLPGNGGIGYGGPGNAGAAGGGLPVQASDYQSDPQPAELGLWQPGSRSVRPLGRVASGDYGVIGTATPPGSGAGTVAWIPASCGVNPPWRCVTITNTATMSGLTVRSPTRYGFALGGAITPDGRWLAAFAITSPGSRRSSATAQLVIIAVRTGAVRWVPGTRQVIGAATLWAAALGGDRFVAGGAAGAYEVDVRTLSARPLPARLASAVNFSAVVFPPR